MRTGPWLAAAILCAGLASGCVRLPANTAAVTDFSLDRYLGRWYEIARLDHFFEDGLDCVTATYSRRKDGGVNVINRGVDLSRGKVSAARGRAYFVAGPEVGRFKVSFFGPFYGGYNILAINHGYRQVLVAGPTHGYLWILARTPTVHPALRERLVSQARALDFPVDELVYPDQGAACRPYRQQSLPPNS